MRIGYVFRREVAYMNSDGLDLCIGAYWTIKYLMTRTRICCVFEFFNVIILCLPQPPSKWNLGLRTFFAQ
jgi:hypothetical protein